MSKSNKNKVTIDRNKIITDITSKSTTRNILISPSKRNNYNVNIKSLSIPPYDVTNPNKCSTILQHQTSVPSKYIPTTVQTLHFGFYSSLTLANQFY